MASSFTMTMKPQIRKELDSLASKNMRSTGAEVMLAIREHLKRAKRRK